MPDFLAKKKNEKRKLNIESNDADLVARSRAYHAEKVEKDLNESFDKFEKCEEAGDIVATAKCKKDFINGETKNNKQ